MRKQHLKFSFDQYRASMPKAHITNNHVIIVVADSRTVFPLIILFSRLFTIRSTQRDVMPSGGAKIMSPCLFAHMFISLRVFSHFYSSEQDATVVRRHAYFLI